MSVKSDGGRDGNTYPELHSLCLFAGVVVQCERDGRLGSMQIGAVVAEEQIGIGVPKQIFDDISGEPLDAEGVKEARKEEIRDVRKHEVYVKVPLKECWDATGKDPIGTRWVDVKKKGDKVHPEYRSRLVAKEVKLDKREDLFAATPPLEAKKLLFS